MASLDTSRSDAIDGEGDDDDEEPEVKAKPVRASLQTAAVPAADIVVSTPMRVMAIPARAAEPSSATVLAPDASINTPPTARAATPATAPATIEIPIIAATFTHAVRNC